MGKTFRKDTRREPVEYEKDLISYWNENKMFERSVEERPEDERYVFYDGPPFITGVPHHGTLLSSILKDAVPRFWTMKGKRVERVWGWDCHGLPAEVYTEKKLGISDKRDIGEKVSLEKYITTCRANMVQTGSEWEDTIDRIGRWVDFKGAYKTMDKEYMESVWWAFKELYEKGKIYEGEKVLMYCPRDATPISKAEVAMDNSYSDDTDPTAYARFKVKGEDNRYLLAWTTTPWTLLSNSAIAVNKDLTYADVKVGDETYVVAEDLVEETMKDDKHKPVEHEVVKTYKGSELVGLEYEPLVDWYVDELGKNAFKVWHADFVHADEGTGVAHESPAYGEEDYELSQEYDFPWVLNTDENGRFTSGEWEGENIWEANKDIVRTLSDEGKVWRRDQIYHPYPHCYRCDTKLIYRAHPSWFMDIDGQKQQMIEGNNDINWFPEHIKHGRFENTMKSAPDWNLSRDRFWATAMPIWKGVDENGEEHIKVVGSYEELKELSGVELDDYHRPWIDDVTFEIDGVEYTRTEKVLDCWFESGSMPFAQFHYPFENKEQFEKNFPGDFIVEYVGQVRAWFYYMHAVSTGLFGKNAFKNVVVTGSLLGNDGRKLSKSLGNYTDPNELMDEYSADALRLLMMSSPVVAGEDFSIKDKEVSDVNRKLAMIWNMYDFFTLYAEVDEWEWKGNFDDILGDLSNPLDRWIVSKVHKLQDEIEEAMEAYDLQSATKPILPFIDDASNWYVRRSRKRFWKSENDEDKNDAYKTLHYVLVQLAHATAPFTPFLAEELFMKLTGEESVHLREWVSGRKVDEEVIENMDLARQVVTQGLADRSRKQMKLRQPLSKATVHLPEGQSLDKDFEWIVLEELNVKTLNTEKDNEKLEVEVDAEITEELKLEGYMREILRHVQKLRKQSGLDVDDRIKLAISSDSEEITEAVETHKDEITRETLADDLVEEQFGEVKLVKVDGKEVYISLESA